MLKGAAEPALVEVLCAADGENANTVARVVNDFVAELRGDGQAIKD